MGGITELQRYRGTTFWRYKYRVVHGILHSISQMLQYRSSYKIIHELH